MKNYILLLFLGLTTGSYAQYHVYSDLTNLFTPQLIETRDGGYLMLTYEDCYTPGAITIEGCMYALYLIKTNTNGDTIWTSRVGFNGGISSIYENLDGTFTLIGTAHESWQCENTFIGLYGFAQIQIVNLDEFGRKINRIAFPDECELSLRAVQRVSDKLFVVMAEFDKPIYIEDQSEERIFLMDNNGAILKQIEFSAQDIVIEKLFVESPDVIQYFYSDTSNVLHLKSYNLQLQEIDEKVNSTLKDSCFLGAYNKFSSAWANNGDLIFTCIPRQTSDYNFYRFSSDLTLKVHSTTSISNAKNFIETTTGSFIVVSTDPGTTDQRNTRLNYLDSNGNLNSSYVVHAPDIEDPAGIYLTSSNEFVIVGGFNCCNLDTSIGPGKFFLLLGSELPTSTIVLQENNSYQVYPNPSSDIINISLSEIIQSNNEYNFMLYTLLGNKIIQKSIHGPSDIVSLDGVPSGIYFFCLLNHQNQILSGKLVKQ